MCFSAPASFAAGAGLAIIGTLAVKQAKTRPQYLLAFTPLIFSVQQVSEGFLWLSLQNPDYAGFQYISMYLFLVFAQVLWPAYVPYTMFTFETGVKRKKTIGYLSALGALTAAYLLFCLVRYPVTAAIEDDHITYKLGFPFGNWWSTGIAYMLATVVAPLLSSNKGLKNLGLLLFFSYLVTTVWYNSYFISVWCYFAAVLSGYVLYFIWSENRTKQRAPSLAA